MTRRVYAGIVIVLASTALCGCSEVEGQRENSGAYEAYYSSFVQQLRAEQINLASINGVSYEAQCANYLGGDEVLGNVAEGDHEAYLSACVDAHTGVFGFDENG